MIIDITTTEAKIHLTIPELLNLLTRMRVGVEHLPTGTVPVSIDVKTHVWRYIEEWRNTHGIEDVYRCE